MKTIEAYQCEYCTKIYANEPTAKSHERKCFWNPKTRSCASCTFLDLMDFEVADARHIMRFQVCLKNVHIKHKKLKTDCSLYQEAGSHEGFDFRRDFSRLDFDKKLAMKRIADQVKELSQKLAE